MYNHTLLSNTSAINVLNHLKLSFLVLFTYVDAKILKARMRETVQDCFGDCVPSHSLLTLIIHVHE